MTDGWISYTSHRPPAGVLCRFRQRVFPRACPVIMEDTWVGTRDALTANVAGLYWQLTGIGKMQEELNHGSTRR